MISVADLVKKAKLFLLHSQRITSSLTCLLLLLSAV